MPPRPRFDKLEPERKEAILDAATREFAKEGEVHASLNKILADAGVSKGAAYYYFDDKEDLFLTVLSRVVERAARAIGGVGRIETEADFWREFRSLYERVLGFLRSHPTLAALSKRFFAAPPSVMAAPQVGAMYGAFRAWFTGLLEQGQKVGAVRTDLPMDLLVALTFGLGEAFDRWTISHWDQVGESEASLGAVIDACVDLFKRTLAPPGKTKTRAARKEESR
jgi:AcrR family transcriptional regulator